MFRLTRTPNVRKSAKGSFRAVLAAASRPKDRDGGNWHPRQVDGEHASPARQIARIDPAIVRPSAPSAEGETKTHVGSIGAALLEWAAEIAGARARQATTRILDFDEDAIRS